MPIDNLPLYLQETIQKNFLERRYLDALFGKMAYRKVASKEKFPTRIGETLTKTRASKLAANTVPLDPTLNTNLDNGMTAGSYGVEQFTIGMNSYGSYLNLNLLDNTVNIVSNFLKNAENIATAGMQSRERLARDKLFSAYISGNTWILDTLAAPGTTIHVDDIRGFDRVYDATTGAMVPVDATHTLPCYFDDGDGTNPSTYLLVGSAADAVNVSSLYNSNPQLNNGGISGTLTFSTNVTVAAGTQYKSVRHYYAPIIIRPNNKTNFMQLTPNDTLDFSLLTAGVNMLRNNGVKEIDGDFYSLFMDYSSQNMLLKSDQFKYLTATQYESSPTIRRALIDKVLGSQYDFTTETIQQTITNASNQTVNINRVIISGADSLIEAEFDGTSEVMNNMYRDINHTTEADGLYFVVRAPLDILGMNIAQSWFWVGDYVAPTDILNTKVITPTATGKYFQRAVIVETSY